jgi:hypothetical protein
MKKLTLLLMLMVASVSFGQLKKVDMSKGTSNQIGKIQPMGTPLMMELTKSGDNVYTFTYRDAEFQTMDVYKSFVLVDTGSDLETLYQMIVEGFATKAKEPVVLELKDQFLYLRFDGKVMRFVSSTDKTGTITSSSAPFSKKQIDKLFGKEK